MEVWKIIFLSKWVICMFHVNLPGCIHQSQVTRAEVIFLLIEISTASPMDSWTHCIYHITLPFKLTASLPPEYRSKRPKRKESNLPTMNFQGLLLLVSGITYWSGFGCYGHQTWKQTFVGTVRTTMTKKDITTIVLAVTIIVQALWVCCISLDDLGWLPYNKSMLKGIICFQRNFHWELMTINI